MSNNNAATTQPQNCASLLPTLGDRTAVEQNTNFKSKLSTKPLRSVSVASLPPHPLIATLNTQEEEVEDAGSLIGIDVVGGREKISSHVHTHARSTRTHTSGISGGVSIGIQSCHSQTRQTRQTCLPSGIRCDYLSLPAPNPITNGPNTTARHRIHHRRHDSPPDPDEHYYYEEDPQLATIASDVDSSAVDYYALDPDKTPTPELFSEASQASTATVGKGKGERVAGVGGETGRRAMLLPPLATTTTTASGLHVTGSVKSTVHQPNTRLSQESECLHTCNSCSMAFEGVWDMYPECSFMYTRGRSPREYI